MKKAVILSVLLFCATIVKAQDNEKIEIRISYSDATFLRFSNGFANALSDAIVSGISGVTHKDAKNKTIGMFEAGYRYNITERLKMEVILVIYNQKTHLIQTQKTSKALQEKPSTLWVIL